MPTVEYDYFVTGSWKWMVTCCGIPDLSGCNREGEVEFTDGTTQSLTDVTAYLSSNDNYNRHIKIEFTGKLTVSEAKTLKSVYFEVWKYISGIGDFGGEVKVTDINRTIEPNVTYTIKLTIELTAPQTFSQSSTLSKSTPKPLSLKIPESKIVTGTIRYELLT